MYIDYNRIITNTTLQRMDEDRYNELREIAEAERTVALNKYHAYNVTDYLAQRAHAVAYTNASSRELNQEEKAILEANITFDDDKFISILNKGNFEVISLETFVKLLSFMTYKFKNNMKFSDDDNRYLNTIDIYAKKIVNHFTKNIGDVDQNIIINKLVEVVTYQKELLINNEKKRIR